MPGNSEIFEPVVVAVAPTLTPEATDPPPLQTDESEDRNIQNNPEYPTDSESSGPRTLHDFICPICMDPFIDPALTNCVHHFCTFCLANWFHLRGRKNCPSCRASIEGLSNEPEVAQIVEELIQEHFTDEQKAEREVTKEFRRTSDIMTQLGPNPLETLMSQTQNEYRFEFDSIGLLDIDIRLTQEPGGFYFHQTREFPQPAGDRVRRQSDNASHWPTTPVPSPVAEITELLDAFEISLRHSQTSFRNLMEGLTRIDGNGRYFRLVDGRFRALGLQAEGHRLNASFPNEELDGSGGASDGYSTSNPSDWYWNNRYQTWGPRSWMRPQTPWGTTRHSDEIPVHDREHLDLPWDIGVDMLNAARARPGPGEPDPLDEFINYPFHYLPPPGSYGPNQWGFAEFAARHFPSPPLSRRSLRRPSLPQRDRRAYEEFPPPPHPNQLNGFPFFDEGVYPEYQPRTYFAERPYEYMERRPGPRRHHSSVPRPHVHTGNHISTEAQNICVVQPDGTETWIDLTESPQNQTGGGIGTHGNEQFNYHRDDGSTGERPDTEEDDEDDDDVSTPQEENYEIGYVVHHHRCHHHGHGPHSTDPQQ